MLHPLLTLCLRCYKRPQRTRRMLDCIQHQSMKHIELIAIGDACDDFKDLLKSEWFKTWRRDWKRKDNELFCMNSAIGGRDWGAKITNIAIKVARGYYFMFLDNDDMILEDHAKYYYQSILEAEKKDPNVKFVYNPMLMWNAGYKWVLDPSLESGKVGHGSLIVNTKFLQTMPAHQPVYGQDWLLIQDMMKRGVSMKGRVPEPTYYVMSQPNKEEAGID